MSTRTVAFALALGLLPGSGVAADDPAAPLTGRVVDAVSGAPLAGARVEAGGHSTGTGPDGTFTLTLPPGAWTVAVSAEGYAAWRQEVRLTADGTQAPLEVALLARDRFREAVEVTAPAPTSAPAELPVRPLEVATTAGGGDNIFRTLHTLPGVAATEEFGSRLAVRGGGPDQNLTVMDGVEVHNPYRLFGLTSAFNPEIVESFELFAGAFSAKYGDRLSSLLVVENRAGTRGQAFRGSSALSLTDANVVLEGRLPGARPASWLVTGRRTYYDLVANAITDTELPAFDDVQAKVVCELRPGRRLSVFGLRSREAADVFLEGDFPREQGDFVTAVGNDLAALSFHQALAEGGSARTTAAFSDNTEVLDVVASFRQEGRRSNAPPDRNNPELASVDFFRDLSVRDLSLRQEVARRLGERHFLEAGFELHRLRTRLRWEIAGERNPTAANGSSVRGGAGLPDFLDSTVAATRLGLWVQDRLQRGRLTLEPGLRLDRTGVNRRTSLSPRLGVSYVLDPSTRLRAGGGVFTQSPGYEKLIQADYFVDLTTARGPENERAVHALVGVERDLPRGVTARVEAYLKRFDRMLIGRLETEDELQGRLASYDFPDDFPAPLPNTDLIVTSQPVNGGKGRAWGFDVFLMRRAHSQARLSGWASYTYGVANRHAYGRSYPFDYDRRHALSVAASYRARRWLDLATTTRVASGFPRTPAVGLRVATTQTVRDERTVLVPLLDADGGLVFETDYGGVGNLNRARLPLFARVDFRATFRPRGPSGRWQLYLDVINLLNRRNAGVIETRLQHDPEAPRPRLVDRRSAAIPLLPSIGVRFRF